MLEKQATAGWRLSVPNLLEKHAKTFEANLSAILKGDDMPNVKVRDLRNP